MKRPILLFVVTLAFSSLFAQVDKDSIDLAPTDDQETELKSKQPGTNTTPQLANIIKLNASSLLVKNISLQYERVLTRKTSVALGIRLMPKTALPFRNAIENSIADGNDNEAAKFLGNAKSGGFAITPEFRYYFSKTGYGNGLYLAPFLRYERFNLQSIYPFENKNKVTTDLDFKGHYQTFGIGVLLGSQFRITDRLTLDWWIAGPYYTAPRISMEATGYNLSTEDQVELKEQLEDTRVEIGNFNFEANVDGSRASIKTKGSLAAIRGFGLCLGVRL